jgi:hypothetical protein
VDGHRELDAGRKDVDHVSHLIGELPPGLDPTGPVRDEGREGALSRGTMGLVRCIGEPSVNSRVAS